MDVMSEPFRKFTSQFFRKFFNPMYSSEAKEAVIQLLEMGAETVIITLGSQGAVYAEKKENQECFYVPAHKVNNVIDTTGAGDAFLGALAFHLAKFPQKPLHQHIGYANLQASYSVQYPGTQTSFPSATDASTDPSHVFAYEII